jgi:hypothetical protein
MSPEQEQQIRRLIQDPTPDLLKMNYALWTRQAISGHEDPHVDTPPPYAV